MASAGPPLLPVRSPPRRAALAAACCALVGALAPADRFTARGTFEPTQLDRVEPALLGHARTLRLHGFVPNGSPGPLVLIAAPDGATAQDYDGVARHLASHGFAALLLRRDPDESWLQYSDALALAARQLPYAAVAKSNPWSRWIRSDTTAFLADRDAEVAAVRAAAKTGTVTALVLIDGDDAGPALPWLDQVRVPFLFVRAAENSASATDATAPPNGFASFNASGAGGGRRWHVELRATGPLLAPHPEKAWRIVERDFDGLVARFLAAHCNDDRDAARSLAKLERFGTVDRECHAGAQPIRVPAAGH